MAVYTGRRDVRDDTDQITRSEDDHPLGNQYFCRRSGSFQRPIGDRIARAASYAACRVLTITHRAVGS